MAKVTVLPKPVGPYRVGLTHLNFVDKTRVDSSPQSAGENRDIPIIIWYPVDETEDRPPSKLLSRPDLASLKTYPLYRLIPNGICDISTNSYEGAALSTQNPKYPVLIFNHGFSSYMEQNTILMEHLASFGYIVVSAGHPNDGVASYPDGRSIPVDMAAIKELTKQSGANSKTFSKNIKLLAKNDLSVEEIREYTRNYLDASQLMNDKIGVWVEDIRFVIDILENIDCGLIQSQFAHKLDFEKGIGVLGQSFGGAASVLACCLDSRLTCAINIDGAMYGGMNEKYRYMRPTLYMDSDMMPGRSRYFFCANEADTYHLIIKGSKHLDYSDFTYVAKIGALRLMQLFGTIDGKRMIAITNDYVLSFFGKYINRIEAPLLEHNPYREVVFEMRFQR